MLIILMPCINILKSCILKTIKVIIRPYLYPYFSIINSRKVTTLAVLSHFSLFYFMDQLSVIDSFYNCNFTILRHSNDFHKTPSVFPYYSRYISLSNRKRKIKVSKIYWENSSFMILKHFCNLGIWQENAWLVNYENTKLYV